MSRGERNFLPEVFEITDGPRANGPFRYALYFDSSYDVFFRTDFRGGQDKNDTMNTARARVYDQQFTDGNFGNINRRRRFSENEPNSLSTFTRWKYRT